MYVQTSTLLPTAPNAVWPLLCHAQMDEQTPCLFQLGVPKPMECHLVSSGGSVGAERRCISNQGTIHQRITQWEENRRLSFVMERNTLPTGHWLQSIDEQFDLQQSKPGYTRVTRTTHFVTKGPLRHLLSLLVWVGLKTVHRYVFRNFTRLLTAS